MSRAACVVAACCVLSASAASARTVGSVRRPDDAARTVGSVRRPDDAARTTVTEASVRSALATFLKAPTSPASRSSMRTIVKFAEESDKVSVLVSVKAVPWGAGENKHGEILLCAFIAGNIRSQLDSGVNRDDGYSGLIQVFRVYRHLKKRYRGYTVPEIERQLEMHRAGKLMRYLLPEDESRGRKAGRAD